MFLADIYRHRRIEETKKDTITRAALPVTKKQQPEGE